MSSQSATGTAGAPKTGEELNPRRWAILGVLVVSLLVVVLDNTVMNVALPTIQRELKATQEELVWAINSYTCVFAALLFTWGVLGDRYGRKKILIIGLIMFGLASALTAFSPSPLALIIYRGIMGIGGASVLPVTLAIITVVFPPQERGKAIGAWAASVGAAVAIGPVVGGLLIEHFWWGSVFFINVPIVIAGVIGIIVLVPESKNPHPGRLDPLGVLLSVAGLLLLTYGILHGGDTRKWGSLGVLGPLLGGLVLLVVFVYLEWRSDHPSLDLSLFKIRSFSVSLAAVSLVFGAMFGSLLFLTYYMQLVRGYSPLRAGLCVLPVALGQLIGAPRSAKMVNRFGARRVISFGLILVTAGLFAISRYTPSTPLWVVLLFFFIWGLGMGNVVAPATTRMTLAVPPARSGAGSAVQNTVRQVAASLGVAVISSVVAVVYSDKALPQMSSLPAAAQKAASDSIGGAYAVARQLPADAARSLQDVANSAFIHALHVAALMAAALILVALAIILLWLPAKAEAVAWGNRPAGDASPDGLVPGVDVGPHGAGGAADSVEAVDETHLDDSVVEAVVEDRRLIDAAEPGDGELGR